VRALKKTARHLLLLVSLSIPSAVCFADEVSDAQALWTKLGFNGAPVTPYPEPKVEDYLKYDRAHCGKWIDQLIKLSDKYRNHAVTSSRAVSGDVKSLHSFIFDQVGPGNACFHDVANAYILESLLVSDPTYLVYQHDTIPISKNQAPEYKPDSPATFIAAAAMLNAGRIQALTPALRAQFGSGWADELQKPEKFTSPYSLRGAYSCVDSKIYLDPEMPPVNLASNLEHEMDHFIRDRMSQAPQANADWKSILLEDEVLALTSGVYSQLVLTQQPVLRSNLIRALSDNILGPYYPGYQLKNDGSLFSKDGPFDKIFSAVSAKSPLEDFLYSSFLSTNISSNLLPEIQQVFLAVNTVYFPNSTLSSDLIQSTLIENAQDRPPGLYKWLWEDAAWLYGFIPDSDPKRVWEVDLYEGRRQLLVTPVLSAIDRLMTGLETPSPMCQALIAQRSNADVQNYIGSKLSTQGQGQGGATSPGEAGVKGGESGVKGGESGVKGGEAGVKGDELVRACVILEENE
jgi:hypothetical protein